ncbi:MAG TPA: YggT family protein [SAR86 cluster bacterium]|mgnify:CR=1 FL=1|nr:YggT family protein [SAR86 cluster bacterium]
MSEATFYLFKALMDIFTIGVVFNFFFRLLKVDYYNPLVQGIIKAVDFPSQILRSFIKPIYSLDLSALLVAVLIQSGAFYLASMAGSIEYEPIKILIWSVYSVVLLMLKMAWWIMLGGIIFSWLANSNNHPAIVLIRQMSDQFFKPFRVFLPPMGGLDFSPIFAFIALNFFQVAFIQFAIDSGLPVWLSVGF